MVPSLLLAFYPPLCGYFLRFFLRSQHRPGEWSRAIEECFKIGGLIRPEFDLASMAGLAVNAAGQPKDTRGIDAYGVGSELRYQPLDELAPSRRGAAWQPLVEAPIDVDAPTACGYDCGRLRDTKPVGARHNVGDELGRGDIGPIDVDCHASERHDPVVPAPSVGARTELRNGEEPVRLAVMRIGLAEDLLRKHEALTPDTLAIVIGEADLARAAPNVKTLEQGRWLRGGAHGEALRASEIAVRDP